MEFADFAVGDKDERDDLRRFFNHIVREGAYCDHYIATAEEQGDQDLAEYFKEIQAQDRLRAFRMKEFLIHRYAL